MNGKEWSSWEVNRSILRRKKQKRNKIVRIVRLLRMQRMPHQLKSKRRRNKPKLKPQRLSRKRINSLPNIEPPLECQKLKNYRILRFLDLVPGKTKWKELLLKTHSRR